LLTFAIAFGLTGLAEIWSTAVTYLHAPGSVAEVLWGVAVAAVLWLIVAHIRAGAGAPERLIDQLRHPVQGPLAAIVPVTVMLVGAHVASYLPAVGTTIVLVALAGGSGYAGWILAHWLRGNVALERAHGGFLLPTVALGFVGSLAAAMIRLDGLAIAMFAVGTFFWMLTSTIVIARIMIHAALPDALTPTLAILLAPPAVAGLAWFAINGHTIDGVALAIAGLAGIVILMQLALLPRYLALPFGIGFWSFTFPVAAAAMYVIEWLAVVQPFGWQTAAWLLVAAVSSLVLGIAVRSVRLSPVYPRVNRQPSSHVLQDSTTSRDGSVDAGGAFPSP
jgi:tellurite resistance protein